MRNASYAILLLCMGLAGFHAQSAYATDCRRAKDEVRFEKYFSDRTLRVDCSFCGKAGDVQVNLDELLCFDGWAGRRVNLDSLPVAGCGDIVMRDIATGRVIYRHSFSTLFHEWLNTEEAVSLRRSFENCFMLPFPRKPAMLTLTIYDSHQKALASQEIKVDPSDALIRTLPASRTPWEYVHRGGPTEKCIDVVFVAEGYTEAEMPVFMEDCRNAAEALWEHEPFASMKDRFNLIALKSASEDSGVSVPQKGRWASTAVGSSFDTFYMERYLTTLHLKALNDLVAGVPCEHFIILANTEEYGGGGIYNSYTLTTAHHRDFRPVVVHEFGHSFGALADEYYYDDMYSEWYHSDVEPWEQNITTLADFSKKWADMVEPGTPVPTPFTAAHPVPKDDPSHPTFTKVGVYEGAGYSSKGVYRPVLECRMKINAAPDFCPVCRRAIERIIRFHTE